MTQVVMGAIMGVSLGAAFYCFWARLRAHELLARVERTEKRIHEYVEEHHARNQDFLRDYDHICKENRRMISQALGLTVKEERKNPS